MPRLTMQNDDLVRFHHMLDAASEAVSFAKGRSREDLETDRMFTLSIIKAIEMIGDAASKLAPNLDRNMQKYRGLT